MKRETVNMADLGFDNEIIDVRSQTEYATDHIPGAVNLPVLNDEERKLVGWTYKHESSFKAKRIGAALVAKNIANHIELRLSDKPENWSPIIYCWRGGKRSGSMSLVFRQIGWQAKQLAGGYKSFRRHVIKNTDTLASSFHYVVICGLTGTAKTDLITEIKRHGGQTLDLEGLAQHRGSVLGFDPSAIQPTQKKFETEIWYQLQQLDPKKPVFVESESKKIGDLRIPEPLINTFRQGSCINITAGIGTRSEYLKKNYAHLIQKPSALVTQLNKLRSKHGNGGVDFWLELISRNKWDEFIRDLLEKHYDASYTKSMQKNFNTFLKAPSYHLNTTSHDALSSLAESILSNYSTL
ncbi:MAG: tRNA 2-selenouridine(34) synthase MnmH [Betaproteobacteria bacterium TMED22]|nr:MAG: tRNA 2-selenouridine(34) synthase MnmH [Betaproteobacteria bacterium TMED22]|tara:strand:+ start:34980 stop:36035 length:1056 start_codon:yes stop_codon:yes gene_type:complete